MHVPQQDWDRFIQFLNDELKTHTDWAQKAYEHEDEYGEKLHDGYCGAYKKILTEVERLSNLP